jgi:glycerol-1-phosphate dehydrogenase [NAD(P)+]
MILADSTRPASAAEHLIAHYFEIKKLERKERMPFHGEKVGVGTLMIAKLYHDIIGRSPTFGEDNVDWDEVYKAYGPNFKEEVDRFNNPSIMDKVDIEVVKENWQKICEIIKQDLPTYDELLKLMNKAKALTTLESIEVDRELAHDGAKYHPYMRYRINLTRLIPMLGLDIDYYELAK